MTFVDDRAPRAGGVRFVAEQEGITVSDDALLLLARAGEGSMRDSLSAFASMLPKRSCRRPPSPVGFIHVPFRRAIWLLFSLRVKARS